MEIFLSKPVDYRIEVKIMIICQSGTRYISAFHFKCLHCRVLSTENNAIEAPYHYGLNDKCLFSFLIIVAFDLNFIVWQTSSL